MLSKQAPHVDFGAFRTFYLRPEIRELGDDGGVAVLSASTAQPLLKQTEQNLIARGYRSVNSKQDADLDVEMVYTESISTTVWCYSWWDPYYYGYPTYYYYPYYGSCDSTAWRSGMLATIMVDVTGARANPNATRMPAGDGSTAPQVPGVWFSGVYGIALTSSGAVSGINQAFSQSPYLAASSSSSGQKDARPSPVEKDARPSSGEEHD